MRRSRYSHPPNRARQGRHGAAAVTRAYRGVLHTIRTVSTASKPMIVLAIISVDHASSRPAESGAAIAQWPTVFADDANGKLNDQHEIVNGRRR